MTVPERKNLRHHPLFGALISTVLIFTGVATSVTGWAFTVAINPGAKAVYLRVGTGTITGGNYNSGGTPANNTTINTVSVTVPANALGNGTPQPMTTNGTQNISHWDGYAFCNLPEQVYIGGFYRKTGSGVATAILSSTSPANLTAPGGNTIPFTQISWVSSGNGDSGAQPIPSGTFNGGTQTLASFTSNVWNESCHTFSYANSALVGSGVYSGRVTYTLSSP